MAVALAVARPLLDAQDVQRGDLRRQSVEDGLARSRNMKQAAARHRRQRFETRDLDATILQLGRRLLGNRHVPTLQVDEHHIDRRARHAGQLHDRA